MKIFVCVLVVGFIAWFGYSMYRDGYTTGTFEERRKRIRSLAAYNRHLGELRAEIDSLKEELEDIRESRNDVPGGGCEYIVADDHTRKNVAFWMDQNRCELLQQADSTLDTEEA